MIVAEILRMFYLPIQMYQILQKQSMAWKLLKKLVTKFLLLMKTKSTMHAEKYACNYCDFIFRSTWENGLLIHISSVHDTSEKKSATTKGAVEQFVFELT